MKMLLLILGCLSTTYAFAQSTSSTTSTTSTKLSTVVPAVESKSTLSLDLSQSANQFAEEQSEALRSTDLEIVFSKTLTSGNKLGASASLSHNETGFNDTTFSDMVVSLTFKPNEINRDNTVTYSTRALLPTSEKSLEVTKLHGAASLRASLTSKKQLAGKPLTLTTYVDGLKYSHQFKTDGNGEGLMSYRVRVLGGFDLEVTEKITLGVAGYYQAGRSHQNALRANFLIGEELAYTPKKDAASFYVAHTNDGNALGPNGEDSNIEAFSSTTSVFSAGVRATF